MGSLLEPSHQSQAQTSPSPLCVVSTGDVLNWLHALDCSQYATAFEHNDIDGHTLRTLTSTELRDDLQVSNLFQRRKLLAAIAQLPPAPASASPSPSSHFVFAAQTPPSPAVTHDEHEHDLSQHGANENSTIWSALSKRGDKDFHNDAPLTAEDRRDRLPEHGRVLDHLSNVRTYHSWLRVGVQFLSFAIVTLRLAPDFRYTQLVSVVAFYFASVALFAMVYAAYRYRRVIRMIERSRLSSPKYEPDVAGAVVIVVLLIAAAILSFVVISLPAPP